MRIVVKAGSCTSQISARLEAVGIGRRPPIGVIGAAGIIVEDALGQEGIDLVDGAFLKFHSIETGIGSGIDHLFCQVNITVVIDTDFCYN